VSGRVVLLFNGAPASYGIFTGFVNTQSLFFTGV